MVGDREMMWKAVWSQESVVSTARRLRLEYRKLVVRFMVWVRDFTLFQNIQICFGVHPTLYSTDNWVYLSAVKVATA
jgi:hypothetical protein